MNGVQYSNISDVSAVENTFYSPSEEESDDSDMEINTTLDYAVLNSLGLRCHRVEGLYQHVGFQSSQPSTSLPTRDSAMDGVRYTDIKDVCADENTFDWPSHVYSDDVVKEINGPSDCATLDSRLRSQGVEGAYQDECSQCCQPATSLSPSELPATTETSLQNQSLLESQSTEPILPFLLPLSPTSMTMQNPEPLSISEEQNSSSRAGLVESQSTEPNPREVITSEEMHLAVTSTAAEQDMERQLRHQQLRSVLTTIPLFPLPLSPTSMAMQNPEPLPIPEERNSSSREGLMQSQSTERNTRQISRLEKMQKLTETFSKMRNILGFSKKDIRLVLTKLSGKCIEQRTIGRFEGFNVLFANMCHLKSLLERLQEDVRTSRTTSYSLRNKSKSVVSGLQGHENITATEQQQMENVFLQNPKPGTEKIAAPNFNTRTNGAVSKDRSDRTTDENMGHRMSKARSDGSNDVMIGHLHNGNLIGEDDDNQEVPAESVNSTVSGNCKFTTNKQTVPRRSAGNNYPRYIPPRFKEKIEWIPNLMFPDMVRACQFLQSQPKQKPNLDQMLQFVEKFKIWRTKLLGFTQWKVVSELKKRYHIQMSNNCIVEFEKFYVYLVRLYQMKPAVEKWLKDIHIWETQAPIFGTQLHTLQDTFRQNPNPNAEEISNLAKSVNLDNAFVTIWFQKRRQIQDCINNPNPTFTKKDKENIAKENLQRALMYSVRRNPQFRTYHEALVLPEGAPSSEADSHTAVSSTAAQQDIEHQSRHQQLRSELTVPPFSLPVPHTSMPMQNPELLSILEEENSSSRQGLVESQSTGRNPAPIQRLEDMYLAVTSAASEQDMLRQSRHQKLRSEPAIPPFSLPVPHTSMPMQNPEPLPIPEEQNSSSREGHIESQSTERNRRETIRVEEMQELTETFSKMRSILGFSQKDVRLVLAELSGKCIDLKLMNRFDGFNVLFDNMCHLKSLLERIQKDVETFPTTNCSLRNKSKSADCGLQGHEIIATKEQEEMENDLLQNPKPGTEKIAAPNFNTRTNGAVPNDRPDSTIGEHRGHRMSKERSGGSDDVIGEDDVNQENSTESVNSTASGNCTFTTNKQAVPRRFAGHNHSRHTSSRFSSITTVFISSLLSPGMDRACQFLQSQPKQMISLEEMQQFVKKFKKWRTNLKNFTHNKVISALKEGYGLQISNHCMEQFEGFNESFERIYEIKPAAEAWLKDIYISKTQGPIFGTQLRTLQDTFRQNPNPNVEEISNLAKSVNLDNAFVTIWFQKRRQIQDCINRPIPTSTDKDKENISPVSRVSSNNLSIHETVAE